MEFLLELLMKLLLEFRIGFLVFVDIMTAKLETSLEGFA